jgi:hypothetical protein
VAEVSLLYGDREWFHDARTPERRMAVSTHVDAGVVVVSFWQGDVCTATFRLRLADAARVVSRLTAGLAEGVASIERTSEH